MLNIFAFTETMVYNKKKLESIICPTLDELKNNLNKIIIN